MKVLIKIGGTLLDSAVSRQRLASEIGQAVQGGLSTVVVHGGSKQMTRYLEQHGVESRFVNGLRVTTPEVLDAVLKVFAGGQSGIGSCFPSRRRPSGRAHRDGWPAH